ncbi:hypothetical protein DVJ77_13750 [Dyella tabacisoli]|uniref:Uncharacterized protein n=1 Tax=Dyella tabacisoli TaxID=2282381 RepID=A0A369UL94_9GAMM|nr:hypothetical protein DVJ77_13750 [Dyella tabacisoli]
MGKAHGASQCRQRYAATPDQPILYLHGAHRQLQVIQFDLIARHARQRMVRHESHTACEPAMRGTPGNALPRKSYGGGAWH